MDEPDKPDTERILQDLTYTWNSKKSNIYNIYIYTYIYDVSVSLHPLTNTWVVSVS